MKFKRLFVVLAIIVIPALVFAASFSNIPRSNSSGKQTSDGIIYTGMCAITAVTVHTDGSNDATLVVYNGTTTGGTDVLTIKVNAADQYGGKVYTFPLTCGTGIYADITGTNAYYYIEYIYQ